MLSKGQEKRIRSLHSKKGRYESGLCLVEGEKVIKTAGDAVISTFTREDTPDFDTLVTTETPQKIAGIARIPEWKKSHITSYPTIIVLDGVQDPGNVGTILRLCLGFNASLILVDSADPTNPKVVRSSVGALFQVPWIRVNRKEAPREITDFSRPLYRLEQKKKAIALDPKNISNVFTDDITLIAGSEGHGITLPIPGQSIMLNHDQKLESLNVAVALGIILQHRYTLGNRD